MKTLSSLSRLGLLLAVPLAAGAAAPVTAPPGAPQGGGPQIAITPGWLTVTGDPGGAPVTTALTIANAGDAPLGWSVLEAETGGRPAAAPQPTRSGPVDPPAPAAEPPPAAAGAAFAAAWTPPASAQATTRGSDAGCEAATPGLIVHDDGTPEGGYGAGSSSGTTEMILVDRFTPAQYPARITRVCVALISNGSTSERDFDVVVYDTTGDNGTPGNLLGTVPAHAGDIPGSLQAAFISVDISSLRLEVTQGSVFIGVRYNPTNPLGVYVAADESPSTPSAGGYAWFDNSAFWQGIQNVSFAFSGYRALLIRALERPNHCSAPQDIPWLSVDAAGGMAPPGGSSTLNVTLDPTALTAGHYAADLCFASSDPTRPLVVVPVEFTVGQVVPAAEVTPGPLAFEAEPNVVTSGQLTIANAGAIGSSLTYEITTTVGDCASGAPAAWLTVQPGFGQLADGTSAPLAVYASTFAATPGLRTAQVCIASNDPARPLIAIPVTVTIGAADALFGSGFEAPTPLGFALDDGTPEEGIGWAGPFLWLNRFTPDPAALPLQLTQVQVYWEAESVLGFPTGVALGQGFDVFVYVDPDGDPANGAEIVAQATGQTVSVLGAFQTIDLPQPVRMAAGSQGDLLIGVVNRAGMTDPFTVPAAIDMTATRGRSWLGTYPGAPATPPVLPAPNFRTIEAISNGSMSGNWLIRGVGTQADGTATVLQ